MIKLYVLLAVIGVAIAVFKFLMESKTDQPEEGTYEKRKILTDAEQSFYLKLKELVADRYYIFPQIHLANLLTVKARGKNWKRLFNKVIQKSVDFVLVDKITFETKLVIELDDSTHLRKVRIERDSFVNSSLKSAGIAILHVKDHNLKEIEALIKDYGQTH